MSEVPTALSQKKKSKFASYTQFFHLHPPVPIVTPWKRARAMLTTPMSYNSGNSPLAGFTR